MDKYLFAQLCVGWNTFNGFSQLIGTVSLTPSTETKTTTFYSIPFHSIRFWFADGVLTVRTCCYFQTMFYHTLYNVVWSKRNNTYTKGSCSTKLCLVTFWNDLDKYHVASSEWVCLCLCACYVHCAVCCIYPSYHFPTTWILFALHWRSSSDKQKHIVLPKMCACEKRESGKRENTRSTIYIAHVINSPTGRLY